VSGGGALATTHLLRKEQRSARKAKETASSSANQMLMTNQQVRIHDEAISEYEKQEAARMGHFSLGGSVGLGRFVRLYRASGQKRCAEVAMQEMR
jgi:hypothetical protein